MITDISGDDYKKPRSAGLGIFKLLITLGAIAAITYHRFCSCVQTVLIIQSLHRVYPRLNLKIMIRHWSFFKKHRQRMRERQRGYIKIYRRLLY